MNDAGIPMTNVLDEAVKQAVAIAG